MVTCQSSERLRRSHCSPLESFVLSSRGPLSRSLLFIIPNLSAPLPHCCPISCGHPNSGMVGLAPKWVRFAPNGTNPGLFQIPRQMHWNLIWKSPGFVPFGANLTHFGVKPTIPAAWTHGQHVQRAARLRRDVHDWHISWCDRHKVMCVQVNCVHSTHLLENVTVAKFPSLTVMYQLINTLIKTGTTITSQYVQI